VDRHRFKGKVENCWMCLEISVTKSQKILTQSGPRAKRGRPGARRHLLKVWLKLQILAHGATCPALCAGACVSWRFCGRISFSEDI
jgi:hypothetical protein